MSYASDSWRELFTDINVEFNDNDNDDDVIKTIFRFPIGVELTIQGGVLGVCGIAVLAHFYCGEKNSNLRCCGDLKSCGVR